MVKIKNNYEGIEKINFVLPTKNSLQTKKPIKVFEVERKTS